MRRFSMKLESYQKKLKLPVIVLLTVLVFHSVIGSISLKSLWNLTALEIIFGGIFLSIIISFSFETLVDTAMMIKASFSEKTDYSHVIHKLHDISIKVKREGVLSLQSDIEMENNIFLKDALVLLNDYKKPETMGDILQKDIEARRANLYRPYNVLKMIANVAPSFGLIGTLLGLIGLLSDLGQASLIMNNMSSALVSTLYGGLIANFAAVPLMGRLKEYIDHHILQYTIIMEGVLLIAQNDSPRNVFDKMNVMLKEEQRLVYPKKEFTERNGAAYEFQG
jgi:chemotaxis protein MotA